MEIKIKCPTCGKILRLQDSPTINNASFTCPVCKEKHKVGECPRVVDQLKPVVPVSEETQYGQNIHHASGDETQIGSAQQTGNTGTLVDSLGRNYKLSMGINTIGRKASTSTSTVQIDVEDRFMSRNSHAIIEVRDAGGQVIHIIKNGANKNPSYVNGVLIGPTDQLILNNGDRIKMGMTELIFAK